MKKIKVCIVDDNRELVNLLDEYISTQGDMEVVGTAHNGQDCINLLEDVAPDVLILDIIMPHLDGLGVLRALAGVQSYSFPQCYYANCLWTRRCNNQGRRTWCFLLYP